METHIPYEPVPEALARVFDGRPLPNLTTVNESWWLAHVELVSAEAMSDLRDVYDAEVASIDAQLRALFAELERRGTLGHAVVVLTADHGEEFKDHGGMGHGKTLYDEQIHVPLIVLAPGAAAGRVVDEPVALIDVAPTVLDLGGLPAAPSFEGRSLRATLGGRLAGLVAWLRGSPAPAVYSEQLGREDEGDTRRCPPERSRPLARCGTARGPVAHPDRRMLDQHVGKAGVVGPQLGAAVRVGFDGDATPPVALQERVDRIVGHPIVRPDVEEEEAIVIERANRVVEQWRNDGRPHRV